MSAPLSFEKKKQSKDAFLGGGFQGPWVSKSGLQGFVWPVWGRGEVWGEREIRRGFSYLHGCMSSWHVDPLGWVSLVGDTLKPRSA